MIDLLEDLKWRGLLKDVTNEQKIKLAIEKKAGVYIGFDPTADSLHVGHLVQIIALNKLSSFNLKPIAVVGGGTGRIGDPSFKKDERKLLSDEQIAINISGIKKQLEFMLPNIKLVNNADWLQSIYVIDFLRDVGKDFNLAYLLAKESIATRIQNGLSITEFFYNLLQAYDFYNLYKHYNCWGQMGGSDQWGNIVSGLDYISSQVGKNNSNAFGVTLNLFTKNDGTKFGKTESGAVWLDSNKTSVYEFYQFWFNQEDNDVERLLKFFTLMSKEEIIKLLDSHSKEPFKRLAQKELAKRVTVYVHGEEGLNEALMISEAMFSNNLMNLNKELLAKILPNLLIGEIKNNTDIVSALVDAGIASSKRQSREWIQNKAISVNNITVDEKFILGYEHAVVDGLVIIKRGKKNYMTVKILK